MCLGMANGYRVPEKENINENPKTNVKTIIEKTEERLKKAETDGEKIYLSAFLDGAKAQKEENHFLMKALFPETEVWERRLQEKDKQIQKLINEVAYLKRKLAKSPENRFDCCICVERGEIYTKSLADYDALLNDIRKCLIQDIEKAYKARQLIITHDPVRYVRIPLHLFEKLVEEKIKTPETSYKEQRKNPDTSLPIEDGIRIFDKMINTFLGGDGI